MKKIYLKFLDRTVTATMAVTLLTGFHYQSQ